MAGQRATIILLAVTLSLVLGGCAASPGPGSATGTAPGRSTGHHAQAALVPAGDWATAFTYTLERLSSCEVGDALTVVLDRSAQPLRITHVAVTATGDAPGTERNSVEVVAVRAGSTTGALAAGYDIPHVTGRPAGAPPGALLLPVAASGTWYVIEVRLHVLGDHPAPWAIAALTVRYQLGRQSYTAAFPQFVHLPPVTSCPG